jgi:hypothetical protein
LLDDGGNDWYWRATRVGHPAALLHVEQGAASRSRRKSSAVHAAGSAAALSMHPRTGFAFSYWSVLPPGSVFEGVSVTRLVI